VTELRHRCDCDDARRSFTWNIVLVGGFDLVSHCSRTGVELRITES
jgi:hypothetical protein